MRRSWWNKTNIALAVVATLVWGVSIGALIARNSSDADAVKATDFQYGRIIDDAVFYNKNAMTVAEIDAVLRKYSPSCDTWGTKTQTDSSAAQFKGWTRARYAEHMAANGSVFYHKPPYICIADYREDAATGKTTFDDPNWKGGKSVAEMIYDAGQKYNINPQVLIVTLRKESRLFTDDWPVRNQYIYAMGYGCPDSGPGYSANCNPKYAGFATQMESAAWQFNNYKETINERPHRPGKTSTLQYAPTPSCGTRSVYIENLATASLYIYTPYVPNAAALANYPGEATCGAYGNRNFFMYFNEWFGSTYKIFTNMEEPRYMEVKADTRKISMETGERVDQVLVPGQIIFFKMRTIHNGEYCLRSEYDTDRGYNKCVPMSELREYTPFFDKIPDGEKRMELIESISKINLVTRDSVGSIDVAKLLVVSEQIEFDGELYYRTSADSADGLSYAVRASSLREETEYSKINSIELRLDNNTAKHLPGVAAVGETFPTGLQRSFVGMTRFGGKSYYQTEFDAQNGFSLGFAEDYLLPAYAKIEPLVLTLSTDAQKNSYSGYANGDTFSAGLSRVFIGRIAAGSSVYYLTEFDRDEKTRGLGFDSTILSAELIPMEQPREMRLRADAPKLWVLSNAAVTEDGLFMKGMVRNFVKKIKINGQIYLQTEFDAAAGTQKVFPDFLLDEV